MQNVKGMEHGSRDHQYWILVVLFIAVTSLALLLISI